MAITGAVLVGGVSGGVQAYFGNKSSKRAAKSAREAAHQMALSRDRAVGYQRPYEAGGRAGFNALTGLLTGQQYDQAGKLSNTLSPQERTNLFQKSPGYQFRLDQGQNSLMALQASRGGLASGGAMREMEQYSQGIASDEYGRYTDELYALAGMGQNAANSMANAEVGAGSQIANYTQQAGMAMANRDAQMGNISGNFMNQAGGAAIAGMMKGGQKPQTSSNFSSSGGGQYNNSVFNGAAMPNTSLRSNY